MVQLEHKVESKEHKEPPEHKVPQELKVLSRQHKVLKVLQVSKGLQVLQDQLGMFLGRQVELVQRVMLEELDLQVPPQELRVPQDLPESQVQKDLVGEMDLKVPKEVKDSKGFQEKHRVPKDHKGVLDQPEQQEDLKEQRVLVVVPDSVVDKELKGLKELRLRDSK
jgi:hypothetical protein